MGRTRSLVFNSIRFGLLVVAAFPVRAQELVWEHIGVLDQHSFGGRTAVIGDIDADGYPELVHRVFAQVGASSEGQLWTLSGRDGATLRTLPEPPLGFFQALTSAGDMDGDGCGDYAVTFVSPPVATNVVEVRSGRDDSLIWSVEDSGFIDFGRAILGDLDVDADGRPDLVVTASFAPPFGRVYVFSNAGALLYTRNSTQELGFGTSQTSETLGRMGDLDGDGADDFVVGGGDRTIPAGAAIVFSGRTGEVLAMGCDPQFGDGIGESVDGCGDMDGDGVLDFVSGNAAVFTNGVVAAFSGATGEVIHVWRAGQIGSGFDGRSVRSEGIDVDRDGVPDVVVGSPRFQNSQGAAFVFSGRDGSTLFVEQGGGTATGAFVDSLGLRQGSPFPQFAVSAPQFQPGGRVFALGRLRVYQGSPLGVRVFGEPCAGSLLAAPKIGLSSDAISTRVTVHDAPAGAAALLLLGTSHTTFGSIRLPWSLAHLGFRGCALLVSADVVVGATTGTVGIDSGYAALTLPVVPGIQGTTLYAQWLVLGTEDQAPGGLSDAAFWDVQ